MEHQETLCPGCGGDLSETTVKENAALYRAEDHFCYRCAARSRRLENIQSAHKPGSPRQDHGLYVVVNEIIPPTREEE